MTDRHGLRHTCGKNATAASPAFEEQPPASSPLLPQPMLQGTLMPRPLPRDKRLLDNQGVAGEGTKARPTARFTAGPAAGPTSRPERPASPPLILMPHHP